MLRLMGREREIRLWLALGLLVLGLAGCAGAPTAPPAPTATTAPTSTGAAEVTVRQLIDHSDQYADRPVVLSGKIVLECTQGCWLFVDDGTGRLYVDLQPAGLNIPQMIGSQVRIQGRIKGSGSNLQILGETVEFPK
jgi:uncharacterized protein YdeI (BOF family)